MEQNTRWSWLGVFMAAALAQSCSLLVDFEECQTDADCGRVDQCVDAICEPPDYVEVTDFIVEDTTWTSDNVYVLKNVILVIQPATLTIEPGTLVLGERSSALVTQGGARLVAEGTREEPIVFTSAKPVGQRRAGDWGGLALIGKARINRPDMFLNIVTDLEDARVGGEDDSWDCGTLRYVRSEFGGGLIDGEKALNGITLAGCGSQTQVDYVQSHFGDDDGFEIFGGTVDVRHVVVTRPQGDGFDLDVGWRGTGQFLAAQMDVNGEEAIEIENRGEEPTAAPMTDLQIYNFTVIGAEDRPNTQRGVIYKSGGMGALSHGIVMSTSEAVHVEGTEAAQNGTQDQLLVRKTLFYQLGQDPFTLDEDAAQVGFDSESFYRSDEVDNRFGADPGFEAPYDLGAPDWTPAPANITGRDIEPPPEGFDPTAVYLGAFSPSAPGVDRGVGVLPEALSARYHSGSGRGSSRSRLSVRTMSRTPSEAKKSWGKPSSIWLAWSRRSRCVSSKATSTAPRVSSIWEGLRAPTMGMWR